MTTTQNPRPRSIVRTGLVTVSTLVVVTVVLATAFVAYLLIGFTLDEEEVCMPDQRPVYSLTSEGGGMCVDHGEAPEAGYADYPEGRVPQIVDDKYDRWPLAADYPWADEVDPALRAAAADAQ